MLPGSIHLPFSALESLTEVMKFIFIIKADNSYLLVQNCLQYIGIPILFIVTYQFLAEKGIPVAGVDYTSNML